MDSEIIMEGTVEDIIYTNPENGYTVLELSLEGCEESAYREE